MIAALAGCPEVSGLTEGKTWWCEWFVEQDPLWGRGVVSEWVQSVAHGPLVHPF